MKAEIGQAEQNVSKQKEWFTNKLLKQIQEELLFS